MNIEKINESIEVLAAFRPTRPQHGVAGVEPLLFKWAGKRYRVIRINLVHTLNDGREQIHYFSVSGEGATYRLAYRPRSFSWKLEEVWLE